MVEIYIYISLSYFLFLSVSQFLSLFFSLNISLFLSLFFYHHTVLPLPLISSFLILYLCIPPHPRPSTHDLYPLAVPYHAVALPDFTTIFSKYVDPVGTPMHDSSALVSPMNTGWLEQLAVEVKTYTRNCKGTELRGVSERGESKSSIISAIAYHPARRVAEYAMVHSRC